MDDMYKYPMGQLGRMKMSHMVADSEAELHEMADRLDLKRSWCHRSSIVHYDVCMSKREEAIHLGAIPLTIRELVRRRKKHARCSVCSGRGALPYREGYQECSACNGQGVLISK